MKQARSVINDNASACFSGSDSITVICVTGCLSVRMCGMRTSLDWQRIGISDLPPRRTSGHLGLPDFSGIPPCETPCARAAHEIEQEARNDADVLVEVDLLRAARGRFRELPVTMSGARRHHYE